MWVIRKQSGFTIVELLIVIVVIAILAAITIISYTGIQNRAYDAAVSSDLNSYAKKASLFAADKGRYPDTDNELSTLGLAATKSAYVISPDVSHNLIPCRTSSPYDFAIAAISKSGKRLYATGSGGVQEYTGGVNWLGLNRQNFICGAILSGSVFVADGVGYYSSGFWRDWISG